VALVAARLWRVCGSDFTQAHAPVVCQQHQTHERPVQPGARMSLAITHVLYLLDHAPWLASNHKNLRACVDDTRQRLVIDHGDYDAWDKAYGLLGYSDPQTGLLIARHMSTLNAH